jgi:serine/threonine protein phosphatase PrpC
VSQAVLWGSEHPELGDVAVVGASPAVAIGLTAGWWPKPYPSVDPNEDAVAAVAGPRGVLLVCADAHTGAVSGELAAGALLDRLGADPPPADLSDRALVELFHEASSAVLATTKQLPWPRIESRTTLVMALLVPGRLQWAALGDSALFVAEGGSVTQLNTPAPLFCGYPMSAPELAGRLGRGVHELEPGSRVVLASDGYTDYAVPGPAEAVAEVARAGDQPPEAVRELLYRAGHGGAGDHVAVALAISAAGGDRDG